MSVSTNYRRRAPTARSWPGTRCCRRRSACRRSTTPAGPAASAGEVLRVGEGARLGGEDRRVPHAREGAEVAAEDRREVAPDPGHHPGDEQRIAEVARQARAQVARQRPGGDDGERGESQGGQHELSDASPGRGRQAVIIVRWCYTPVMSSRLFAYRVAIGLAAVPAGRGRPSPRRPPIPIRPSAC